LDFFTKAKSAFIKKEGESSSSQRSKKTDIITKLNPYLPSELVGGSIPYVEGKEEESVWNAASQACATEKVHFTYTIQGKRCWYIACPSSSLASNPDSWCPLAAALPGNSEFWDKETVYLYEQEGMASALRWDADTGRLQVSIGAARTLLPRIQGMDATFVTINPEDAQAVPWINRALMTERLSRTAAIILLLGGIAVNLLIIALFIGQVVLTNQVKRDEASVKSETDRVSAELMEQARDVLQSEPIKHLVRIQQLLDELKIIDGTLLKYEVDGDSVNWEALVPPANAQGLGSVKGTIMPAKVQDGRVRLIGTR
jgi:hypothetical protein